MCALLIGLPASVRVVGVAEWLRWVEVFVESTLEHRSCGCGGTVLRHGQEVVRDIYAHTDNELASEWVDQLIDDFTDPEMPPEIPGLGRTISRWLYTTNDQDPVEIRVVSGTECERRVDLLELVTGPSGRIISIEGRSEGGRFLLRPASGRLSLPA